MLALVLKTQVGECSRIVFSLNVLESLNGFFVAAVKRTIVLDCTCTESLSLVLSLSLSKSKRSIIEAHILFECRFPCFSLYFSWLDCKTCLCNLCFLDSVQCCSDKLASTDFQCSVFWLNFFFFVGHCVLLVCKMWTIFEKDFYLC